MDGEKELGKKRRSAEVLPNRQFEAKTRILPNHRAEAKARKWNIIVSLIYRIKYKTYEEKRGEEEKEVKKQNAKRRDRGFIRQRHLPQR